MKTDVINMPVESNTILPPLFAPVRTSWQERRQTVIGWHILVWILVFSLPYLLRLVYDQNTRQDPNANGFLYLTLASDMLWIIAFYTNAFVLMPQLLFKKKAAMYALAIIGMFGVMIGIHGIFFRHFLQDKQFYYFLSAAFNAPAYLLSIACSTLYRFYIERAAIRRREQEKEQENLKTELSFLRSQISPHFIFNVLNNIVALARLKSDQLEPTVVKLSSLMQYMLYDTNEEKVQLSTETEYLESYIDLQRQRFGSKVNINCCIESSDQYEIEPMLLIPFVENAFKHGVGLIDDPEINIDLHTKNGQLFFLVKNKYNPTLPEEKDKASGIGLANVQRRLNLLYKKEHTISIRNYNDGRANWFEVSLQLNLH